MARFRIFRPFSTFFKDDGTLNAGGYFNFYITDTTTPKNVYSLREAGVSLGSTIALGLDGRPVSDFWAEDDTPYRVRMYDADDDQQGDDYDDVQPEGDAGDVLPAMVEGEFIYSDGASWLTRAISEVPDMTGMTGRVLGTDGNDALWQVLAAAVTYDADNLPGGIEASATSVVIGDVRIQWGADTCPSISALTSTKSVTFDTAFSATPYAVVVTSKSTGVTSNSPSGTPTVAANNYSTTGFTATAFVGEENTGGTDTITSAVNFTYVAFGPA